MITPVTGALLIAEPFLKDPSFMRSVVLICRHVAGEGSFGFALHKTFTKTLDELIPGIEGHHFPVYHGGPVQLDTLHYIHQYPDLLPDCQQIGENIYWGGDFELLKILILNNEIDPQKIRFFLGYSGWGAGQLDDEIAEKSWIVLMSTPKIVFDTAAEECWRASLLHLGGKYEMLIHFPTDPQLN